MSRINGEHTLELPRAIERLGELAFNLWWSWQPESVDLFRQIDNEAWEACEHNPISLLHTASAARLTALAADPGYRGLLHDVLQSFDAYMHPGANTWYARKYPESKLLVGYFCAEYGLHESLPIYSGGLGVLAGDHCKAASDIGLPFLAVGLWYSQGYFRQRIDTSGHQIAGPEAMDQHNEPLQYAGPNGTDLLIPVELPGRTVTVRVWLLQVGRIPVYLLDTDVAGNQAEDRALCARLYGGDREMRIAQEVVLGIGGVRALQALGLQPTVWHMNEGHAGFMGLERMRAMVQSGIPFTEAWPLEAEATVFTTHTPVPAGNEVFRNDLVMQYLPQMPEGLGLDTAGFLALAHEEGAPDGTFAMTPLALRLSHYANGVSALHGAVARQMWMKQFSGVAQDDVPITSVTNGVHTGTWIAPEMRALFSEYLGQDWLARVDDPKLWEGLEQVPDAALWAIHSELKKKLLAVVNTRAARGEMAAVTQLDPTALTIGFARRFATYKRATLFFHDLERAVKILTDRDRPVQIIFAGKAHPADGGGQALIASLFGLAHEASLAGKVVFLSGYDMALARTLVQGVDVWLNNPERPQEASGTSGQKAALNGVPNCSIRDGWWDEGYNGHNGWAFGGAVGNDAVDSEQLYTVLEEQIVPAYFERNADGLPLRWIATMKEAIRTLAPQFSAQRMVKEYTERLYQR